MVRARSYTWQWRHPNRPWHDFDENSDLQWSARLEKSYQSKSLECKTDEHPVISSVNIGDMVAKPKRGLSHCEVRRVPAMSCEADAERHALEHSATRNTAPHQAPHFAHCDIKSQPALGTTFPAKSQHSLPPCHRTHDVLTGKLSISAREAVADDNLSGLDDDSFRGLLRHMVHPDFAHIEQPSFEDDPRTVLPKKRAFDEMIQEYTQKLSSHKGQRPVRIPVCGTPEQVMAAINVAMYACGASISSFNLCGGNKDVLRKTWLEWQRLASNQVTDSLRKLPSKEGSYSWVCIDNSAKSRLERLACACASLQFAMELGGTEKVVQGTKFIYENTEICPSIDNFISSMPHISHSRQTAPSIAYDRAFRKQRVALVNAASAYHVGGGFLSGGRHALEEALCTQTDLFFSLQHAANLAKSGHIRVPGGRQTYIPLDAAILSSDVTMFRHGSDHGYEVLDAKAELAAVISIAMPNRNERVQDSAVDRSSGRHYEELIRKKMRALLKGAWLAEAVVLVMPDVGCGVFQNDPEVVGRAFGKELREFHGSGLFSEVVITGNANFYDAVRCHLSGHMKAR